MSQRIRVTTKASQFQQRKQEHLQAGYRIEDEQPCPINGFCSFTAVRIVADDDPPEPKTNQMLFTNPSMICE
jgi:hypothetical protein